MLHFIKENSAALHAVWQEAAAAKPAGTSWPAGQQHVAPGFHRASQIHTLALQREEPGVER